MSDVSKPHSEHGAVLFLARETLRYHEDGMLAAEGIDEPNEVTLAREVVRLFEQLEAARWQIQALGGHAFVGRLDRDCEVCGKPDRHALHGTSMMPRRTCEPESRQRGARSGANPLEEPAFEVVFRDNYGNEIGHYVTEDTDPATEPCPAPSDDDCECKEAHWR